MPLWDNIVNSKWPFILATLVGYPALLRVDVLSSVEFDFFPLSFFLSLFLVLFFAVLIVVRSPLLLFCFVFCFVFIFIFSFPCCLFFFSSYFCLTASQGSVIDIP